MDLTSITTSDLKKISSLIEKREKLESQIVEINNQLASYGGAPAAPAKRGRKPGSATKSVAKKGAKRGPKKGSKRLSSGGRRGKLKESILAIIKSAGSEGVAVKDVAASLGAKSQNIHSWFQLTGKKEPNIKKVGTGRWAWVG